MSHDKESYEDATGIHYVKQKAPPAPKGKPMFCGKCGSPATCIGRLYVPASKLSLNPAEDVSVLLCGERLFWCDRHFFQLTAKEFLAGEGGDQIRADVTTAFRQRNAFPNFDKAVIGRIPVNEPDFARAQMAVEIARKT